MERRWRVATVRLIRLTVLLLAIIGAGCASTRTAPESANFAQPHEVTIEEACGNPTRFPVSRECVDTMGYPYGSMLQQRSDLLMAVWRACPSAAPCTLVQNSTPACEELSTLKSGTPQYQDARSKCGKAQEVDYSCHALRNDPIYAQRDRAVVKCIEQMVNDPACAEPDSNEKVGSKAWEADLNRTRRCWDRCFQVAPTIYGSDDNAECSRARTELTDFEDRVKKAMLDAQLKAAFAPPEPVMVPYQPPPTVIIQQQPAHAPALPTQMTCMPFGPGVTCNSW